MTDTQIIPCPFCRDPDPEIDEVSPEVWAIVCGSCGAMGPVDPKVKQTPQQAITVWNTRGGSHE